MGRAAAAAEAAAVAAAVELELGCFAQATEARCTGSCGQLKQNIPV